MEIKDHIGNIKLLKLHKTAFFCSRKIPASIVLKCHDWTIEQRENGKCVISGFHSQIEKDVFHYLLKGKQPLIMVLARGMKKRWDPEILRAVDDNRLLILTPFEDHIKRPTAVTSIKRNKFMLDLADDVTVGYADLTGNLVSLLQNINKPILKL